MSIDIAYIGQRGVPPSFGGVERYVDEIVRRLPADEVQSFVYCRRHYVEAQELAYTKQIFMPSLQSKGLEAFSHSLFSAVHALGEGYDLVHFQALGPSLFSFIPKIRGAKSVATIHGIDWQRAKWGVPAKAILKSGDWMMGHAADGIISVSKNLKRVYEEKYRREVFHVPIGFSEARRLPADEIYRKFGLEPMKYLLFLNRLVPEKGIHYAIEAFSKVPREDLKLVIAGAVTLGDRYFDELQRQANGDNRIIFTGYVTREEVHELYSNAYLFLLPSELEGMPAVLLESMSHECPVLISDIQENLDVVTSGDDVFAFVHENKNVRDLESMMRELVEDPDRVDAMREPGCAFVNREYSWDRSAALTYEVYKHILSR